MVVTHSKMFIMVDGGYELSVFLPIWTVTESSISLFQYSPEQRSPTFLAPGTGFMEDNFSMAWGGGMVSGSFKHVTFIVHFISIIITL